MTQATKNHQKNFFFWGGQHGGFGGFWTGQAGSDLAGRDAMVAVALRSERLGMDEARWAIVESFDKYYCLFSVSF